MHFERNFLLALSSAIEERRRARRPILVSIDGPGCGGKSTLSHELGELFGERMAVLELDSFLVPLKEQTLTRAPNEQLSHDVPHLRWAKVEELVTCMLPRGEPATYCPYEWEHDRVGSTQLLPRRDIVVVEGLYALHSRLRDSYDFRIWVDSRRDDRMTRCEDRMHEQGLSADDRSYWLRLWRDLYVPREQAYIAAERPFDHADVFVLGVALSGTRSSFAFDLRGIAETEGVALIGLERTQPR